MRDYLFLFTIGPVQSFISQARKTQDLYSASRILSDLIDTAIKELEAMNCLGADGLIFPNRKIDSKPNRFIALISTDDPKGVGERIEEAVKREFIFLAHKALKENGIAVHPDFDKHIDSFLEVYWAALPYANEYLLKYEEIERSLGAVKNIRSFTQLDEQGRKCGLCGERNVLFYKLTKPDDKKTHIKNPLIIPAKKHQFIKGEGLCAVCCAKRFYQKEKSFPSTAEISLMDTLYQVKQNKEGHALWEQYTKIFKDDFKDDDFNEQLFLEENLTEDYFRKHDLEDYLKQLEHIKKKQKEIRDVVHDKNLKLSKYYAVVVFDGDSMGEWLSGIKIKDKHKLKDFHHALSTALGKFAKFSKNCLTDPMSDQKTGDFLGKAVYAGGDDFLGFVNLNHLFDVLITLRQEFDKQVSHPLAKEFPFEDSDDKISFSAGVAIAHYKTPLSLVLGQARSMEKKAKEVNGKDAVGFTLLKHSGNICETVFKWSYDGEMNMQLMKKLSHALKYWISNKFLYSLREEFLHLFDKDTGMEPDIVEAEIRRLMARLKEKSDISKEETQSLAHRIAALFDHIKAITYRNDNYLENFLSFLEVCNFIARETNHDKH